jgi:transcriptional regulator with XRE-family HTH domain
MGWTQAELAEEWGYSFETVSAWERGKRFPSRTETSRLAEFLDVEPRELAALVATSKGVPVKQEPVLKPRRQEVARTQPGPFSDGRLLWTLHVGVQDGGLQCIISCPLANGDSWDIVLDPETDGVDIQHLYRLVQEQVMVKGVKQQEEEEKIHPAKVLRFGPLAR